MRQTCRQINTLVDYIVSKCIAYVETEHYHIQSCLSNRTNVRKSLSVNPLRYLRELITPKVYILRGFISFSFDRERMRWTRLPDLLRDRGYFQTVVYKNEIFAIGTYRLTKEETAIPSSINIHKNKIYVISTVYYCILVYWRLGRSRSIIFSPISGAPSPLWQLRADRWALWYSKARSSFSEA